MKNDLSVKKLAEEAAQKSSSAPFAKTFKKTVLAQLEKLEFGSVTIIDGDEQYSMGASDTDLSAEITIFDQEFYSMIALGGGMGAAESYISGFWSTDKLVNLIRIMVRNQELLGNLDTVIAKLRKPLNRIVHNRRENTDEGSKKNILAHYDLSNDFYKLFLDPTMTYSSGIFRNPNVTMEDASIEKLDRICRKLGLKPTDHVIEIGTGWGSFAIHAARHYGCKVTTTTISDEQFKYAKEAIDRAGVGHLITLLNKDYRKLEGQYDKLVSIEMIEAVGYEYVPKFIRKCNDLLKPDGAAVIQAITISDQHFERYRKSTDFIQKYIFPGSCLVSLTQLMESLKSQSDMRLTHLEDIAEDYAETLRLWRERFMENLESIRKLGFSDNFIRMWSYYFCYCEGGFRERHIGDVQVLLAKPQCRLSV